MFNHLLLNSCEDFIIGCATNNISEKSCADDLNAIWGKKIRDEKWEIKELTKTLYKVWQS